MKKIKICFFLFLTFAVNRENLNNNKYFYPVIDNINITQFKESILRYPSVNDIKLNYSSKCGEIFKYKKNNKRDLVMFAYKPTKYDFNSKRSLLIYFVIDSIKKNIPKAKIICFVPENSSNISLVIQVLKRNKV